MPIKSASEKSRGAYAVARRVFNREITRESGARELHAQFGMNLNSAKDHIYVYRQMRNGSVFHRALSAPDIEYYLSRIYEEEGELPSQVAIHALWLHIDYYEGVRKTRLHALRSIAGQGMAKS